MAERDTDVRFALDPGPSDNPVPTRSTLAGAAVGIGAIVASLTFAGSLHHFVSTPRSYGWDFDARIAPTETSDIDFELRFDEVAPELPKVLAPPDVRGWSMAYLDQATVGGQIVPVIAVSRGGGQAVNPTIVKGRAPSAPDEVALGAATMRANRVGIGDRVVVGDGSRKFDVVGTVVLPGLRRYESSDQAALGSGALLTLDGLKRASAEAKSSPSGLLVRVAAPASGATLARVQDRLDQVFGKGNLAVSGPERPSDVISYARVRGVPIVLAAVLALLATITVGHALAMAVRQRRIDLAVLHALGFTRRQAGRTVAWQASTVAIIATAIGVPLGLIVGRMAWSAVAHQLGIVDVLVVPMLAVVLVVPIALLLANAMAAVPARRASALRMADALRAE